MIGKIPSQKPKAKSTGMREATIWDKKADWARKDGYRLTKGEKSDQGQHSAIWVYFGAYGSEAKAKKATTQFYTHNADWRIVKRMVGKSVDNAYSDKEGYEYKVWVKQGGFK